MESVALPSLNFNPISFLNRQSPFKLKHSNKGTPFLHSALPKLSTASRDGFCPRALLRSDSYESPEEEIEVAMDPGLFDEVFPTARKQEAKPSHRRSAKGAVTDSPTQSILIPDEWVTVQKHHLRTKKERKKEVLALQFQRAREREAEDRAIKEKAAREARERLHDGVYFNQEARTSRSSSSTSWLDEGNVSGEEDEGAGSDDDADYRWEEAERGEEERILAEFETKAEAEKVSGRARPKDYRSGLEFSSLEDMAERLREVVEAGTSSSSDRGSAENVEDEQPQIVTLTPEEKARLKNRNLNFATISSKSWSPLHTLAAAGQFYLAAELIKRGAKVNALDKEGFTPIHRAIQSGRKMMVRLLLKAGADPEVLDRDGATLLHYAAQTGNHEIARLLLRDEIDVNAADKDGWTPLHVAVQSGRTELIRCLINRGADMNQANKDGNSPFDLSLSFGNCFKFYDTIKFMKRKEAEFRSRRKYRDSEIIYDQLV